MKKKILTGGFALSLACSLLLLSPASSPPAAAAGTTCADWAPNSFNVLLCNMGLMKPPAAPSEPPAEEPPAEEPAANCGETRLKSNGTAWECSFVDEFNGNTLDTSKWVAHNTSQTSFSMGNTCLRTQNITVNNGSVKLRTDKALAPFLCGGALPYTTQYWGAGFTTWTNFSQTYGMFEARVKYPSTAKAGLWGGFWMTPPGNNVYGGWPNSGEIDIAEWWSKAPDLALPTLHYTGKDMWNDSGWNCTMADPSGWHTHRLEWSETEMKVYLDGQLCWTRDWDESSYDHAGAPFDQPFAINFSWGQDGSVAAGSTFPQSYEVDYVKAWK